MKVFTVVIETRNTSNDGEVDIEIIPFWKRKKAEDYLANLFKKVANEREIDLTDPKNDGLCFLEDDYFSFYTWVGGDWDYKASIYARTIESKKMP